jgi:NTE family protein
MSESTQTAVAIACQGGGSHTAFTAGVLKEILRNCPSEYEITALSGTSGGAMCAALAWDGLRRDDPEGAIERLDGFWNDIAASAPWEQLTNNATLWSSRLTSEIGTFGLSPYRSPLSETTERQFRDLIERHVRFDGTARTAPPHLYVGAVNVESGSFEIFTDGDEGVSALLASAAIPTLFRAVEIDGAGHWDGLFSQNPPIRHFTSEVPAERKPDEIWIVRINPRTTADTPRSLDRITDRRNELSGNLSLEQEKHMIESINDLIAEKIITHERYKPIDLREIELDMDLDVHSKLNRDPDFLERLMTRGESKASDFWQ